MAGVQVGLDLGRRPAHGLVADLADKLGHGLQRIQIIMNIKDDIYNRKALGIFFVDIIGAVYLLTLLQ